ncbi:MAG: hypothetical protein U7123_05455 [Potamolinea sp.]
MKAQIVEQIEFFSEAELESLEFLPEELEAIEEERVPDLESISFEDIAEELEAYFEGDFEGEQLERRGGRRKRENRPPQLPGRISDGQYNAARQILIDARSRSAEVSHPRHGNRDGNPVGFGLQLLRGARQDFANNPLKLRIIHRAAAAMGIYAQWGRSVW